MHGQGTETSPDGRVNKGIWENNKFLYAKKTSPTVTAKKTPEKGSNLPICPGSYRSYSWTNCFGTYTDAIGSEYVGEWKDGKKHGKGTHTYADGSWYVGEWKDNKKHGQGIYRYAIGSKYVGEWKDNKKHGQGSFNPWDGKIQEGKFINGKFLYAMKPTVTAQRIAEAKRREKVILAKWAKARAAAKRGKALYDALVATANADLAHLQDFITANPGTPGLIDIVTDVAAVKAALTERKGSSLKTALADLRATLSKKKGFSASMVLREKERKIRLAAEKRRQAAQVKILKEDLKSYAGFLKRQVVKNMVSNSGMAQALVPLVRRLEIGLSSNDLSVLGVLKGRATDALRKHGLSNQYAQVRKLITAARKAKGRKKEEARLVAEKKAAAVLAARRAKAQPRVITPAHATRDNEALEKRLRDLEKKLEELKKKTPQEKSIIDDIDFGTYHALVIGIDNYKHLPKLKTAVNDARAVGNLLKTRYGFKEIP